MMYLDQFAHLFAYNWFMHALGPVSDINHIYFLSYDFFLYFFQYLSFFDCWYACDVDIDNNLSRSLSPCDNVDACVIPIRISTRRSVKITSSTRQRVLAKLPRCEKRAPHEKLPRFIYSNVQSILNKLHYVEPLVSDLKASICVFTETWLNEDTSNMFCIQNFNVYHAFRETRRGGGVSMAVSNYYSSCVLHSYMSPDIELLAVRVDFPKNESFSTNLSFLVVGVYRPPSGRLDVASDSLESLLSRFSPSCTWSTVLGDFNRLSVTGITKQFGLVNHVDFITRVSSNAVLDLIYSNAQQYTATRHPPISSSDHCVISFCPLGKVSNITHKTVKVVDKRASFHLRAASILHDTNWQSVLASQDMEAASQTFYAMIKPALESFPIRSHCLRSCDPPWMTGLIKDLQKRKRLFYWLT